VRSHAARRCRFCWEIFQGNVLCVCSNPLTNSEVRVKNSKCIERTPGARKYLRSQALLCVREKERERERHGYTCQRCGAVPLWCYNVPSILACSRNVCSIISAIIITAYNVSAVKHARQKGFGKVYQVSRAESCPNHSTIEVRPESQHHVQAGLVSWRLGKSKVCFSPYNLSGFTALIFVSIFFIYFYF